MGNQSRLKHQRREERERVKSTLMNQSKQFDDIYKDNKVHTMIFDINQKKKIRNNKPDYITFYNEDTGQIISTFSMNELADALTIKDKPLEVENETEYKIYHPTDLHKKILYKIAKVLTDKMTENKIEYFIDGGSLLGAVRHKDIIPHDDDIDLGVIDEEFDKLVLLLDELDGYDIEVDGNIYDLIVENQNHILKFYVKSESINTNNIYNGYPCVDVFKWTVEDDKIQLQPKEMRDLYKECYYNINKFYPLQKYKLGCLELFGCNEPNDYLSRYYGNDYMKSIKCTIRNEKGIKDKTLVFKIKQ